MEGTDPVMVDPKTGLIEAMADLEGVAIVIVGHRVQVLPQRRDR